MSRWTVLGYGLIGLVSAVSLTLLVEKSNQSLDAARQNYHDIASARAVSALHAIETRFEEVYQGLRTVSLLPRVRGIDRHALSLDDDARLTIQQIYNNLASTVSISDLHVVPASFNPDRVDPMTGRLEIPILTFDKLVPDPVFEPAPDRLSSGGIEPERAHRTHEYHALVAQLDWLKASHSTRQTDQGMTVPTLASAEFPAGDEIDTTGHRDDADRSAIALSVPYYSMYGELRGTVSATLRVSALRAMLPDRDFALVNAGYGLMLPSLTPGQAIASATFAARGNPDPDLIFSQVRTLRTPDLRHGWQLWVGHADRDFLASPEVSAITAFRTTGIAAIALMTLAALALWQMILRLRLTAETASLRDFADAAVEGLAICDGTRLVAVNQSFEDLLGGGAADLIGQPVATLFTDRIDLATLEDGARVETSLTQLSGGTIPVELIARAVTYVDRPHRVLAVRDLTERKQAEEHIRFLALHDALTGLPNRSNFNARLDAEIERARRDGGRIAVMCLDLDRFKEVNDQFGHATGDAVLQAVAARVSALLTPGMLFARLGGDEFALVMPALDTPAGAADLGKAILEAVQREIAAAEPIHIGTSIGIALFPEDGQDRTSLLCNADAALYRAKSGGRSRYRFFEPAMATDLRDRRQIEHELAGALARGEFSLAFQPQVEIATGDCCGFEAMLRWNGPARGEVKPDTFMPLAENSGLILALGEWALRTACREAARWPEPLRVGVNISPAQLHSGNLPQLIHEILYTTGLPADRLELEVTEMALARDFDRAIAVLRHLKALGVKIALDDFGASHSSLSNLRAFAFDKIKIDRSFISQIEANTPAAVIVRAVLGLGRDLGLAVVAEGVETPAELAFLKAEQCREAQGFLLGRPADIAQYRHLTSPGAARPDAPALSLRA